MTVKATTWFALWLLVPSPARADPQAGSDSPLLIRR